VAKHVRTSKRDAGKKRKSKTRAGLPDPASIVSETTLRSPAGRTYRVLRTSERDPYDPPAKPNPKRR
jgi:hypothetical protein